MHNSAARNCITVSTLTGSSGKHPNSPTNVANINPDRATIRFVGSNITGIAKHTFACLQNATAKHGIALAVWPLNVVTCTCANARGIFCGQCTT